MNCDVCRQQLWPSLYDLLEEAERAELAAHLASCVECQAAQSSAREQQSLLAAAVKEQNADIAFKAPTKAAPASTAPTVLLPLRPRRLNLLNRYAAAAAILFVLFTLGGGIAWGIWRTDADELLASQHKFAKAKDELDKANGNLEQKKTETQKKIREIQQEIDRLFNDWRKDEAQSRKVLEQQGAQLVIKGPQVALAGASNPYEIEVLKKGEVGRNFEQRAPGIGRDGQNDKAGKEPEPQQAIQSIQVRAINNKTKKTLLDSRTQLPAFDQQLEIQRNNQARFVLPSTLPIEPGEDIALEFIIQGIDGKVVTLTDSLNLISPEYVTHLMTDRSLYRPGETVRFRSLTLERFSLQPAEQKFHLRFRVTGPSGNELYSKEVASAAILGANGAPILGTRGRELPCVGAGEFVLPNDTAPGPYTLSVAEVNERFNEEKRAFEVNRLQPSRYQKELTFHRGSYAAGDVVKMQGRITQIAPAERSVLPIRARILIDEKVVWDQNVETDMDGRFMLEFKLPDAIARDVGVVMLDWGAGEAIERMTRELPLIINDVLVEFFPEGGDLIAGVQNRVYFQARTPANRPANISGRILDDKKQVAAQVRTDFDEPDPVPHQGLGVCVFTPEVGRRYKLVIDAPIGIDRSIPLPAAKDRGVIMTIPDDAVQGDIRVELMSVKEKRNLLVGAYCRGRMLDYKTVRAYRDQPIQVTLKPNVDAAGVYRITVFDMTGTPQDIVFRPLAERLIYRKSGAKLDVVVRSDRSEYQPGDPVRLRLEALNEKKAFVPAIATIAVVNQKLRKPGDDRLTRSLPAHFLLTTEVRSPEELENADVLLGDDARSARALDLLLGTQGWRRFAEQEPQKFQDKLAQAKNANFLSNTAVVTQFFDSEQKEIDRVDQKHVKNAIHLQQKLASAEQGEDGPPELQQAVAHQANLLEKQGLRVAEVEWRMRQFRAYVIQFLIGAVLLALLVLAFLLISTGLRRLAEGNGNPRRWLLAGLALLASLFVVSVFGTFSFMGQDLFVEVREDNFRFGLDKRRMIDEGPGPGNDEPIFFDLRAPVAEGEPLAEPKKDAPPGEPGKRTNPAQSQAQNVPRDRNDRMAAQNVNLNVQVDALNPNVNEQPDEERRQRQQGQYQALLFKQLGRRVTLPPVNDTSVVRVYAHRHVPARGGPRTDFAATVYWHPALVMPDGKTEIAFELSDAVTNYEVLVHSHTFDGRLATSRASIAATMPIRVDATVPTEVSASDRVVVPVTVQNKTAAPLSAVLTAHGAMKDVWQVPERRLELKPGERKLELYKLNPGVGIDAVGNLRIVSKADGLSGAFERRVKVVPDGFPVTRSASGITNHKELIEQEITLPDSMIPGSLEVHAHLYASPLAELQAAQANRPSELSRNLANQVPALLLLHQLRTFSHRPNPPLEKLARKSVDGPLPSEPDASRFLYLADLLKVNPDALDPDDLPRTLPDKAAYDHADAALAWFLTENGLRGFERELARLHDSAASSKDPGFIALVALSQLQTKRNNEGFELLRKLRNFQKDNGAVLGSERSVTFSRSRDLDVETTALALLAWARADRPEFGVHAASAAAWLQQRRGGNGQFGGSHATALSLKALLVQDQKHPRLVAAGDATLTVPGEGQRPPKNAGDTDAVSFSPRVQDVLTLTLAGAESLRPGRNLVELRVSGNSSLVYTLTWTYRTKVANHQAKSPLKLTTSLSRKDAREGDVVQLKAKVNNASAQAQTPIVVLGLPAGLTLPAGAPQLKKLQSEGKIAGWQLQGRELTIAWRELAAADLAEMELDLVSRYPGTYHGPASRVRPQGDSEQIFWTEPLSIRIDGE